LLIVSATWIDAGRVDHALHGEFPVEIFGEGKQYAFRYDPKIFVGRDALIIGDRHRLHDIDTVLRDYFSSIEELPHFVLGRWGMEEVHLRIFHAHELKRPLPLSQGSRRLCTYAEVADGWPLLLLLIFGQKRLVKATFGEGRIVMRRIELC